MKVNHFRTQEFVKNQHVFHRESLVRFCDKFKTIGVTQKNESISFRAKIDSNVFYMNGISCQYIEDKNIKAIGYAYHNVVRKLLGGYKLNADEYLTITKMYALWKYRSDISTRSVDNYDGNHHYEQICNSEKSGIYFDFAERSSQMITSLFEVPQVIKETCLTLGIRTRWAILSAISGEFVIPDSCPDLVVIPMSPTQLLMAKEDHDCIGIDIVDEFNDYFIESSKYYYYYR